MHQTEMLLNARPAGIITAKPANNHCLLWRLMGEVETNQGYKARRLEMAGLVEGVQIVALAMEVHRAVYTEYLRTIQIIY